MSQCKCGHRLPSTSVYPIRCSCGRVYHGPSRGLGDTIAKVTKAVGIEPCGGCKERQAKLNKAFPYHDPPKSIPTPETGDRQPSDGKGRREPHE
jgi:hypothetical protein